MKRVKTVLEWTTVLIGTAGAMTTVITDRRTHASHGEHSPCDCRGTCLSCLRD